MVLRSAFSAANQVFQKSFTETTDKETRSLIDAYLKFRSAQETQMAKHTAV
jgi:hypothetical protein